MIYTFIPTFPKEKDLGWAYNHFMGLIPNDDDWGCLVDHDTIFTTKNWMYQMEDIIKKHPEYDCFVATANRIGCDYQQVADLRNNHDVQEHIKLGHKIQKEHYSDVINVTGRIAFSGFLMLVKKGAWNKVKFREGGEKMAGIDNHFHRDLRNRGFRIGLMKGVYLYHLYMTDKEINDLLGNNK